MKHYKHLFFDLDRTLWDFDENLRLSFSELYKKYNLDKYFQDDNHFLNIYKKHNERLWSAYERNDISKDILRSKRFILTLEEVGIKDNELANIIGDEYLDKCPLKTALVDGTMEVLNYLQGEYIMHILTNGFRETQLKKLHNCKIDQYFKQIITSDEIGIQKPDPAIFNYALKKAGVPVEEALMIGDNYKTDIIGAIKAGIDQVFFDVKDQHKNKVATYRINKLPLLKKIL